MVGVSPSPRQSGRHSGSNTARSISEIHTARSTDKLQRGLEGQNALLRSINESLEEEVTTFRQVTAALEKGGKFVISTQGQIILLIFTDKIWNMRGLKS